MNSLISADNTWALWAVIITGTMTAIWLEQSYKWATKLSGPVLALLIAMILSNTGVMPTDAPSYAFIGDFLVPLAIPLLLLKANLLKIAKETGGQFFSPGNVGDLIKVFNAISDELKNHYLLAYTPKREADGSWREIELKVKRPNTKVRVRKGYFHIERSRTSDASPSWSTT